MTMNRSKTQLLVYNDALLTQSWLEARRTQLQFSSQRLHKQLHMSMSNKQEHTLDVLDGVARNRWQPEQRGTHWLLQQTHISTAINTMYTACVKRITHRWATQRALDSALVASSVVQQPWHSPPPLAWLVASRYRPDNSTTYDTNNTSSHCMTCIKNTLLDIPCRRLSFACLHRCLAVRCHRHHQSHENHRYKTAREEETWVPSGISAQNATFHILQFGGQRVDGWLWCGSQRRRGGESVDAVVGVVIFAGQVCVVELCFAFQREIRRYTTCTHAVTQPQWSTHITQ